MIGEPLRPSEPQGVSVPQSDDVAGWIRVLSSYETGREVGPELMKRVEMAATDSADGAIIDTMFSILAEDPLLLNGDAEDGLLSERKVLLHAKQGVVNYVLHRLPPADTILMLSRYPEAARNACLAVFSHDSTPMGSYEQALVEYVRGESLEKVVEAVIHEGSGDGQPPPEIWGIFGEQSQLEALIKLIGRDISSFNRYSHGYAILAKERASELMVIFAKAPKYQKKIAAAIGTDKGAESLQKGLALNPKSYRELDTKGRIALLRANVITLLQLLAANPRTQPVVAGLLENEGLRGEVNRYFIQQRRKARETGDSEQFEQTLKQYLQNR